MPLPKISPELLKNYQEEIARQSSPATLKRKSASLSKFFNWAEKEGHIEENPISALEPMSVVIGTTKDIKRNHGPVLAFVSLALGIIAIILALRSVKFPIPSKKSSAEIQIGVSATPYINPNIQPPAVLSPWTIFTKLSLSDTSGSPVTTSQTITFKLYKNPEDTTPVWTSSPLQQTPDASGGISVSLEGVPSDVFFQNNRLFLSGTAQDTNGNSQTLPSMPVSTANTASNLQGYYPASPEEGAAANTIPVISSDGSLLLASESPAIKATNGNLLIEGRAVTINAPGGETNILSNLKIQNANLKSGGSLISGYVGNNLSNYDLINLSSGSKPTEKFSVDAQGNTFIDGKLTVDDNLNLTGGGGLQVAGVTRLNNLGRLGSITGYYQDSGLFGIDQGVPDYARITKTLSSATGASSADVLTLKLDESTLTTGSASDTLVLKRLGGTTDALALLVDDGNVAFDGQIQIGRLATSPDAIGQGVIYYNTIDKTTYVWNGASWFPLGGSTLAGFWQQISGIVSPITQTDKFAVGGTNTAAPFYLTDTGVITFSSDTNLYRLAANTLATDDNLTAGGNLDINGTANDIAGTLNLSGGALTSTGALTMTPAAGNNLNIALSGTGDLAVNTDQLYVDTSAGNVGIGDSTPNYKLDVAGTGYFTGALTSDGLITGTAGLNISGAIPGKALVTFNETGDQNILVASASGTTKLIADRSGNIQVAGVLQTNSVTGTAAYNRLGTNITNHSLVSANDLLVSGNLEIDGSAWLDGDVTLGSTTANSLAVNSYVISNLIPNPGSAYTLGTTDRRWKETWSDELTVTNLYVTSTNVSGTSSSAFTVNTDNATLDTENSSFTWERGDTSPNVSLTWNSTDKQIELNAPLEISQDPTVTDSGTAALIVNQIQAQDIFTASASGTPKFVISNSGNVGIGTTEPQSKLHVEGTSAGANINIAELTNTDTTANAGTALSYVIGTGGSRVQTAYVQGIALDGGATSDGALTFGTANNGAAGERVRIDNLGNVGIGTTAPGNKLDVGGDIRIDNNLYFLNPFTGYSNENFINVTNALVPVMTFNLAQNDYDQGMYRFGYNGSAWMTLSNGSIGIGTTAPLSKLSVGGIGVANTGVYGIGTSYGVYGDTSTGIGVQGVYSGTGGGLGVQGVSYGTGSGLYGANLSTGRAISGYALNGIGGYFNSSLGYALITGTGNVGIGTTTPAYQFQLSTDSAAKPTTNTWTIASDVRIKNVVSDYSKGLNEILQISPIIYTYKENNALGIVDPGEHVGIIAQDVQKVFPEAVSTDENGYLHFNSDALSWASINAIKALNAKIDDNGNIEGVQITASQNANQATYFLQDAAGQTIEKVGAFAEAVVANIRAGAATIDNLLVNGGLVSPVVQTNLISPLADKTDVVIQIGKAPSSAEATEGQASGFGKLIIQNPEGEEVASIDSSGSAEFKSASVSGELYAEKIASPDLDKIQELLRQVKTDQDLLAQASTWNTNTASNSAQIVNSLQTMNLYVTDQAAINSLSVSNSLAIGSDLVFSSVLDQLTNQPVNSLNSISAPLKLQSLAMAPVEIMAGKIRIETNGDITINANLFVAGKIESPEAKFGKLTTKNLIIANPEATQSGVIGGNEVNSNAIVGAAIIPAGISEVIINNINISNNTLIYVTPTSETQNNVLYVKSKEIGKFVVGFSNPIDIDVSFNWWVIEIQ